MNIITKLKQLFIKKKSPYALKMWNKLKDDCNGDPEFHPSLDLDASYALSLNKKDRLKYLHDLVKKRQKAHNEHSS